jgi:ubiquinone/menaquinone biosynthesis C-methylase UbiE
VEGVHPVAAAGFSAAADVYERARPSYPQEAVDWLASRLGLGPGRTVVDVAAGTGKLTRLLVPTGARVIAVEPVPEMLAKLVDTVPGTEPMSGTAEALPLPDASADAITVAQAMHWFDQARALPEVRRVLRDGGALALVWNSRDLDDPLHQRIEQLLAEGRSTVPTHAAHRQDVWRAPLEASPLFGPLEERRFGFEQQFTVDELCDRVSSTSFVAAMQPAEREQLLADIREAVRGFAEPFPYRYVTEVYVADAR